MKKLILIAVLTCALVLGIVATVSADNGPHGSFSATTDACANCHRAHSATSGSNGLLVDVNPEALCVSCHDGTGASTDVESGTYHAGISNAPNGAEGTDGGSLFGGGFTTALMATEWSGATTANAAFNATSQPVTSTHSLGVQGQVYGSGAVNSANAAMTLECTSCHDPHGNSGYAMSANATGATATVGGTSTPAWSWSVNTPAVRVASYRLLRFQPQGSGGFTAPTASNWSGGAFPVTGTTSGWTVPDAIAADGSEWYTLGNTGAFAVGDYNAGNGTNAYNVTAAVTGGTARNYINAAVNTAYFCAQCHDRYFANTRLRNNTDKSAYCGTPLAAGETVGVTVLTIYADADNAAPWIHPVDATRCEPITDAVTGALTGWGDNGGTGDTVHAFMHSSGDVIRASADGTYVPSSVANMTAPTSLGRSCMACHVAHGTTAAMTADAAAANLATGANAEGDSTLLRMDNRSICLRCHASAVGFTVAP